VLAGERTCEAPVNPPGFHVYVVAPLAVKVVELPEQTVLEPEAETVGEPRTEMVFVKGVELPNPLVATSVME
jgi:hypothetical protein